MVDDKLVKRLKTYIRKHYELVEESESSSVKLPGMPSLRELTRGINGPLTGSFDSISDTLSRFIKKEKKSETFSVMLERLRKEKGMTAAQLYNGAWIKKQLYSKIMGERNYHPSKNTVIAFGISLRLDRDEMDGLLESAGYRFSNSSIADLVIMFCLSQNLYDIHDVNALLVSADQNVLCRE